MKFSILTLRTLRIPSRANGSYKFSKNKYMQQDKIKINTIYDLRMKTKLEIKFNDNQ